MLREIAPFLIPLVALSIPIVAMLLKHQRTMAELIHRQAGPVESLQTEIQSLRQELDEAKRTMTDHSLSLDRNVETLSQRLNNLEHNETRRTGG